MDADHKKGRECYNFVRVSVEAAVGIDAGHATDTGIDVNFL